MTSLQLYVMTQDVIVLSTRFSITCIRYVYSSFFRIFKTRLIYDIISNPVCSPRRERMSCVNCNLSTWPWGHGWIFRASPWPVLCPGGDNYFQTTFKWEHGTFPHINIIGSQDRRGQLIIVDHHYLNREYQQPTTATFGQNLV